jgi:hypothetical protein
MRIFGQLVIGCLAALVLVRAQGTQGQAPPPRATAEQVLAEARKALGGEKLDAVKSFVVTGRTRRLQGNNLLPIEFEISCELPDKYVRRDEVPAQENEPTSRGFNGNTLLQIPAPPAPPPMPPGAAARAGAPPAPPPGAAGRAAGAPAAMAPASPATSVKQDFVRLTLGLFATSFSSYPLTFKYVGQAEAPQGKADVLDVTGAPNFSVRFFVNMATHLPVMISWTQPASPAQVVIMLPGQPKPPNLPPGTVVVEGPAAPSATATQEEKDKFAKAVADLRKETLAKPIEYRIYYADYRDTDGLKFPYRLRRAIGPDTTEETTFDRFQINAKINPRKFEAIIK